MTISQEEQLCWRFVLWEAFFPWGLFSRRLIFQLLFICSTDISNIFAGSKIFISVHHKQYVYFDKFAWQHVGAAGLIPRGGSHIGDSYHLFKNFDIDYSSIHVFVIKNFIGLFSILTTTLTSTCHFNSGQQMSDINTTEFLYPSEWFV